MKVSIIVPIYNVYKYLEKCLDSLVGQDYDDYEVLAIDDGSPYGERAIIERYVREYPAIVKGIYKENGGYGSVLEMAIAKTDSDYILICDPDDYLAKDALSKLVACQKKLGATIVVGAKYHIDEKGDTKYDKSFNAAYGDIVSDRLYRRQDPDFANFYFFEPSPHAKLYPTALLKDLKFPKKVSYTDNLLYFYALNKADSIAYIKEPLAYYLIERQGNTHTDVKPKVIDDMLVVFDSLLDQTKGDDIFYFRMFETFYTMIYRIDTINADHKVKKEKYAKVYAFLKRLLPYSEAINRCIDHYDLDSEVVRDQKRKLLDAESSEAAYWRLIRRRTLKLRIKGIIGK